MTQRDKKIRRNTRLRIHNLTSKEITGGTGPASSVGSGLRAPHQLAWERVPWTFDRVERRGRSRYVGRHVTATTTTQPVYTPQARAERLIAAGRFVLAFSSLAAVYLEPSTPAQYQRATYTLLVIYTLYALRHHRRDLADAGTARAVAARLARARPGALLGLRLPHRGTGQPVFSVLRLLALLRHAPLLVARHSRHRPRRHGHLQRAGGPGLVQRSRLRGQPRRDPRGLPRRHHRTPGHLGIYQQQLRSELAALAAWPRELTARIDDVLRATLAHAAAVMRAAGAAASRRSARSRGSMPRP